MVVLQYGGIGEDYEYTNSDYKTIARIDQILRYVAFALHLVTKPTDCHSALKHALGATYQGVLCHSHLQELALLVAVKPKDRFFHLNVHSKNNLTICTRELEM